MNRTQKKSRGQALVMVTLGLLAMCGILGLAVDLGWTYFLRRQAQSAADAAAMAAVREALHRMGGNTAGFSCPASPSGTTSVYCTGSATTEVDCSTLASATNSNLWNGCLYAKTGAGFDWTTGPRDIRIIAYDASGLPPTVTGIDTTSMRYWVTVRTVQTIPQLFSAVLGNTTGIVSARATAAVIAETIPGALILTNREGDCSKATFGAGGCGGLPGGVDLLATGGATVKAPGGIFMASSCQGVSSSTGCDNTTPYAGAIDNNSAVGSTVTSTRGMASCGGSTTCPADPNYPTSLSGFSSWTPAAGTWTKTPQTLQAENPNFDDPLGGVAQPPLTSGVLPTCTVKGGTISGGTSSTPLLLGRFNYYSVDNSGNPDGKSITIANGSFVEFSSSATTCGGTQGGTPPSVPSSDLPSYFFWGGLSVQGNATFDGGMYVAVSAAANGNTVNISPNSGTVVQTQSSSTVGNLFVLASQSYPGLSTQTTGNSALTSVEGRLASAAPSQFIMGGSSTLTLQGLSKDAANLPSNYAPYKDILMWQDRNNSTVQYSSSTNNVSCGKTSAACNNGTDGSKVGMTFQAGGTTTIKGSIYQPRGASITVNGSFSNNTNVQIITGAVHFGGSTSLTMSPSFPAFKITTALIE